MSTHPPPPDPAAALRPTRWDAGHFALSLGAAAWLGAGASEAGFTPLGTTLCVMALLAMVAAAWAPLVALAVFVLVAYGLPHYGAENQAIFDVDLLNWIALLALSGWGAWSARWRQPPHLDQPLLWVMALFLAWGAVSMALAHWRGATPVFGPSHHPAQFMQAGVMLFLASQSLPGDRRGWWFALLLALILALRAVIQGPAAIYLDGDLAAYAAMLFPVALLGALTRIHWAARAAFAFAAFEMVRLVLSAQSRGAAVGLVFGLAMLALGSRRRWRWALASVGLVAVIVAVAPPSYLQRFSAIWNPGAPSATAASDRATVEHRLQLWVAGWQMAQEHPWVGVGPGNYTARIGDHLPSSAGVVAHSTFLQLAAETGFVGLALFAVLVVGAMFAAGSAARRTLSDTDRDLACALQASLAAFLGVGLFLSRHDMVLAYLLVGWVAALGAHHDRCVHDRADAPAARPAAATKST